MTAIKKTIEEANVVKQATVQSFVLDAEVKGFEEWIAIRIVAWEER